MKTILLLKNIYTDGFKAIENLIIKRYFKFFAWFSVVMFVIMLYAFFYRISTGFNFG